MVRRSSSRARGRDGREVVDEPRPVPGSAWMGLQRSIGNRAVTGLVQRDLPSWAQIGAGLTAWANHDNAPEIAFIALFQVQDPAWRAARQHIMDTAPADWAKRWPGRIGVSRGPYNALRHCIWSCLTTVRYLAAGPSVSQEARAHGVDEYDMALTRVSDTLRAHEADVTESSSASDRSDSALDLANNEVGIMAGVEIARANDVAEKTLPFARGIFDQLAIAHCISLFEQGKTKMLDASGAIVGTNGWRQVPDPTIWD